MEMNLKNPWVYEELAKPENNTHLTDELIDKILAFPHDALRQDLEQIIRYHISLGCDDIPDKYDNETFDGSLFNALMLIAEVGTPDASLDAVLDVMRQSSEFLECHICDLGHQVFPPTLYKLGQHRLDHLLAFVKEEGVDIYAKCEVFPAVVQIGLRHPERREEVIEWFRQVLRFATEDLPEGDAFDSELAGLLVCDIIDLQAVELKPEIDALFETGLVCEGICGSYASVIRDLSDLRHLGHLEDCILDIHERYEEFREPCENNSNHIYS